MTVWLLALFLQEPPAPAEPVEPSVVIEEPAEGAYVSGEVPLRARIEPASVPVLRISFSADGRPVCVRERAPFECTWDSGPLVVAHDVRALAILKDGRRVVARVRTKESAFSPGVDVDVVQVAASVTDGKGHFVRGLSRDSFRIYEDGVPQPVTHFVGEGTARDLVVAVDMSGSMAEAMPVCRQAVKKFLGTLKPEDKLTLMAFNDNIFTLAKQETDAEARLRAVDRLAPWGGTALYDVVLKALGLLDRRRGRRALVLFTDGEDRGSQAAEEDVERRVEVSDAPIYAIAQGQGLREKTLKRILDRLGETSGGRTFYTERIDQLTEVFNQISEDLQNQYLLAYDPTRPERDGTWRTIRVEVAGQPYKVRSRQGYRAVARRRAGS